VHDVSYEFDADPVAVRGVRRFTSASLMGWDLDALLDDTLLVVSELVTNVAEHAHTPGRLVLTPLDGGVRVAVEDAASAPPVVRAVDATSLGGRGLLLVGEVSARWGWEPRGRGKVVWAELVAAPSVAHAGRV
jgi:anti-sigma regulatory factor (Ser/Thr protein kinase)